MNPSLFLFVMTCFLFTACNNITSENSNFTPFSGDFRSIVGVMNPLSCYCSNGGYVTTKGGKQIPICFKSVEHPKKECITIKVTDGHYKTVTRKADPKSPCPSGQKDIFMVTAYTCN